MRFTLFIFIMFCGLLAHSQELKPVPNNQPVENKIGPRESKHSPKKASILSAVIPGAGQVYNRKNWWWKVPIIYGAGGTLVYGIVFYNDNYNKFRDAYKYRIENKVDLNGVARFDRFQTPTLKAIRDDYRQARDQCGIGLFLVYVLQIVDASVEAHLLEFNVNDDLSLKVQPTLIPYDNSATTGIQFRFALR